MKKTTTASIKVAAGVLFDEQHRVLITQRVSGKHQAGWWEFPGGKLRSTETPRQALGRELREELGIRVKQARSLLTYTHDYPDRVVTLHVWQVTAFDGQPAGLEEQPLQWVAVAELMDAGLLPADLPVVAVLQQIVSSKSTL
ncbi:MAG: 8-oxo-dGTP diphosphatase MutT [Gammaproteobacteria bacterium]|nr:8-oxo-dGTP diphosphatase MutT [Gammaproteobacteria bacterium]